MRRQVKRMADIARVTGIVLVCVAVVLSIYVTASVGKPWADMRARLGDQIRAGDPLAEIHARNEDDYEQAAAAIRDTVRITEEAPAAHPLIYAAVTREGTRIMQ